MKRLIFALFLLACLSACKKEHIEPMSSETTVNKLPKKVVVQRGDSYTIQHYRYNNQGDVAKFWMYDALTPNDQDSIVYSYNTNNQVTHIQRYFDNHTIVETYTYNNLGNVTKFCRNDSIYDYYYTVAGEVDYIIRYNTLETFQDSIQMHQSSAWSYLGKGEGALSAINYYRESIIEAFLNTENGIYEDRAGPVWGAPSTNVPVCLNKAIDFQDEVAYTIVPIGQAGYFNMYVRTSPYKYATHAEYVIGPMFNFSQYDARYTFDAHGRLTVIDAQALGMPDNDTPLAIPAVLDFTSTLYY